VEGPLLGLPESVLRDHLVPFLPCKAALALGSCCRGLVGLSRTALTDLGVVHASQVPDRLAAHPRARSLALTTARRPGEEREEEQASFRAAAEALAAYGVEIRHVEARDHWATKVVLRAVEIGGLPALDSLGFVGCESLDPFLRELSSVGEDD
jgi:hypothetical protein